MKKQNKKIESNNIFTKAKDYFSTTKLNYYLHKTISPKNTYLVALIIFSMFVLISYFSYAMFTVYEERQRVLSMQAGSLSAVITSDDFVTDTYDVILPASTSKVIDINVSNNSLTNAKIDLNCVKEDDVTVAYLDEFTSIKPSSDGTFVMDASSNNTATIALTNTSSEDRTVTFSSDIGLANATSTGTNYIITNTTTNPYDTTTLAYKLKDSTPFVMDKEVWDYSKGFVSNDDVEGTFHGLYMYGTDADGNTYSCPSNAEETTYSWMDDLYWCKLSEGETCPAGSYTSEVEDFTTCFHYKVNTENEFELSTTNDENGDIVYYYRGGLPEESVTSYVDFAGLDWNVVRINEDGSIKLLLTEAPKTYRLYALTEKNHNYENSQANTQLTTWYNTKLAEYDSQIVNTSFCQDKSEDETSEAFNVLADSYTNVYGFSNRLFGVTELAAEGARPTLACSSDYLYSNKIALLTIDEIFFAGGSTSNFEDNGYDGSASSFNYMMYRYGDYNDYWTISPAFYRTFYSYNLALGIYVTNPKQNVAAYLRPVITLKPGIKYTSGTGKYDDPYLVQ